MTEPSLLITTDEVARLLQVSKWWVYDHGPELGRIEGMRPHRYLRERVEEYVRERAARPPGSSPAVPSLRPVPTIDSPRGRWESPNVSPRAAPRPRPRVPLLEPGSRAA